MWEPPPKGCEKVGKAFLRFRCTSSLSGARGKTDVKTPTYAPCFKSSILSLVLALPPKALRVSPRTTSSWDLPHS